MIQPHFTYGIIAWGNSTLNVLSKTFTLQKRCVRVICNKKYNSHTDPLFNALKILKISDQYKYECLLFMHSYLMTTLPQSFDGVFPLIQEIRLNRITRDSTNAKFHIKRCLLSSVEKFPLHQLPTLWNNFPMLLYDKSKNRAKKIIKTYFISNYSTHITCENERCPDCRRQ